MVTAFPLAEADKVGAWAAASLTPNSTMAAVSRPIFYLHAYSPSLTQSCRLIDLRLRFQFARAGSDLEERETVAQ